MAREPSIYVDDRQLMDVSASIGRTYFQTFLGPQNYKSWLFKCWTNIATMGPKFTFFD